MNCKSLSKMRQASLLLLLAFGTLQYGQAQFIEVSYGAGYAQQAFLDLQSGQQTVVGNTTWDLALSVAPGPDAGIFLNEAAGSEGAPLNLFYTDETDFGADIGEASLQGPIFNTEADWSNGAFNTLRDPEDPFDYGWGQYSTTSHSISGNRVFVLQLRDGRLRKIWIESLSNGVYTIRHANLDGSDEQVLEVDKAGFTNTSLAFVNISSNTIATNIPATSNWDLLFTRYITPLDDGEGNTLDYLVAGTLSAPGVEVAIANGVDPTAVQFADYAASLNPRADAIGYDWKTFDLGTFQWMVPQDRVYFVRRASGETWKLSFVDFEGASTGLAVLQAEPLGILSSTKVESSPGTALKAYPNPARDEVQILFDAASAGSASLTVWSIHGQRLMEVPVEVNSGLNALSLPVNGLPNGVYALRLSGASWQSAAARITIKR